MNGTPEEHYVFSPDQVKEHVTSLAALHSRLMEQLKRGLELSNTLRETIPSGSPEELRNLTESIGQVSDSIEAIQYERLQIVKIFCRIAGMDEPAVPADVPSVMDRLQNSMPAELPLPDWIREKELVLDIRKINRTCGNMLRDSLQSINFTLELISSAGSRASLYDARGMTMRQNRNSMFVLDRRV